MAAHSTVFTIARVAKMLGEEQAWLEEIALAMEPEDGCLDVWDIDDDIAITAFTPDGVENLKQLVAIHKDLPQQRRVKQLRRGPPRRLTVLLRVLPFLCAP